MLCSMKNILASLFGTKHKRVQGYLLDEQTKPDLLIVNGFSYGMSTLAAPTDLYKPLIDAYNIKNIVVTAFNFSSHHADTNPKEVKKKLNEQYYDMMVENRVSAIHYIDKTFGRSYCAEMTPNGLVLEATRHTKKSALQFEQNRNGLGNAQCVTIDMALAGDLNHEIECMDVDGLLAFTASHATPRMKMRNPK